MKIIIPITMMKGNCNYKYNDIANDVNDEIMENGNNDDNNNASDDNDGVGKYNGKL